MQDVSGSLTRTVIDHIRRQIFESKTLTPGDQVSERELARTLNISRAPVREALRELEEQGFITSVKYRGWYVSNFSEEEALEINSIRTLLETYLFEAAIRTGCYDDEDLSLAESLNGELEAIEREEDGPGKVCRFLEKELEFHLSLYAIAKNHCVLAQKLLKNISYQIRLSLSYTDNLHRQGFMEYSIRVHERMIRCLKERDFESFRGILLRRLDKDKDIRGTLETDAKRSRAPDQIGA